MDHLTAKPLIHAGCALALLLFASTAAAQPDPAPTDPASPSDDPSPPIPPSPPPIAPPGDPVLDPPSSPSTAPSPSREEEKKPAMSEGRLLVSLYNSGFHWGISPGIAFANGKAGFLLGVNFGYGFDTGPVILVPGVRLTAYFLDPFVFIEGGVGPGYVDQKASSPDSKAGVALMGGGGFMIHFSPSFALGAQASYQVITGTGFEGFGVGPILAIGF